MDEIEATLYDIAQAVLTLYDESDGVVTVLNFDCEAIDRDSGIIPYKVQYWREGTAVRAELCISGMRLAVPCESGRPVLPSIRVIMPAALDAPEEVEEPAPPVPEFPPAQVIIWPTSS